MYLLRNLLWVDCIAGALAGMAMLALSGWLGPWYGLPRGLLLLMGGANLLYASYSLSLAARSSRPPELILLLVLANLAWAAVCVALAVTFRDSAAPFGMAHLIGEAAFVGGLACMEWNQRDQLTRAVADGG